MDISSTAIEHPPIYGTGKSFSIRLGAFMIDSVAFYLESAVVTIVLGIILGFIMASTGQVLTHNQFSTSHWLNWIISAITSTLYFVIFEGLYGATPGKLILGMRVVKENGEPCDLGAAFIRGAIRIVDGILFGLPAYLTMKSPLYQRMGDKVAKTIVVSSKDPIIHEHIEWWWCLIAAAVYTAIDFVITLFMLITAMP